MQRLHAIKERLLASYANGKISLQHRNPTPLPSKGDVVDILNDLQSLVFPGYFRLREPVGVTLELQAEKLIDSLHPRLRQQIYNSIKHFCRMSFEHCHHCEEAAEEHALLLLEKIPRLREILKTDVEAAYAGDPAAKGIYEIVFSYPGLYAVMVHRVAHELVVQGIPVIPRIMSEHAHSVTGIDIHPGATIGESFFIDHGTGVVIGETAIIGRNVRIYQGVTLGAVSFPRDAEGNLIRGVKRHPTVEDDCVIYSGATVLGGDTVIGRGSVIGGNVWLTHSVPPGSKVMLEEPHQIITTRADESKESSVREFTPKKR